MNYKGREPRDRPQRALRDFGSDAYCTAGFLAGRLTASQRLAETVVC